MGDTSTTTRARRRPHRVAVVVTGLALALLAAGCGGGDDDDDASSTTRGRSTTTDASDDATDDAADARGAVSSLDDVRSATIQVIGQGTFRDPEIGQADGSGAGSGFIISKDGLAVTNNHVVAGAGTLEVHIGGQEKSYNASIVGVSECNDLALIKIKADDDLPFLRWFDGDIKPGLEVHAAGFPLGDPEYTLTNGSITKAKAGGDLTGTSSIDHTIEHDADTQPGNSGGPLVTDDGRVVAVHYAASQATGTPQRYGIAADLARPVVDHLEDGDYESLGINGWAVDDEASGITGIWVAGVAAGSPAADAKLLAGDIVTSMNGVPVGADGTFKDYCDVIRTAGSKAIAVEVLRYDTEEVLRGEINGDQPLEQAFSFRQQVEDDSSVGAMPTTPEYADYTEVADDTGQIVVEVPSTWVDTSTAPFDIGSGTKVPYIAAAPSLNGYNNSYTVPGMEFALFGPVDDLDDALANFSFAGECTDAGIDDYEDPIFTGRYQLWSDCSGTDTVVVVLTAVPSDDSYTAVITVQATSEADLEALDHIFNTFNVLA